MVVRDLMSTEVQTVSPDQTIAQAVATIADAHVYGLPVVDASHGRLIGVISTTDVLAAVADSESADAREVLFENTRVEEIMTPNPATIEPDTDIRNAARLMLYLDVHRLFVVDGETLLGVVSQSDVVRAVATKPL